MYEHQTQACPDFLAQFSDFVDGTLSPARRAEIQIHLDCCEACLRHLQAYRRGVEALREAPVIEIEAAPFWARLQYRLWHDTVESARRRRAGWRTLSTAGVAVAAAALAVIWVGGRIDAGFDRVAESVRQPVVATGSSPAAARVVSAPAEPAPALALAPSRPAASRPIARAASAPVVRDEPLASDVDPARERDFEALRERIEIEAWLGDPRAAAVPAFEPAGIGFASRGVRVTTADVRAAEPIPISY